MRSHHTTLNMKYPCDKNVPMLFAHHSRGVRKRTWMPCQRRHSHLLVLEGNLPVNGVWNPLEIVISRKFN